MRIEESISHYLKRRTFLKQTALTAGTLVIGGLLPNLTSQQIALAHRGAALSTWDNVAIGGGEAVPGIVIHPSVPDVLYIRTDVGGMYRWNSSGQKWMPLLDWLPYNQSNLYGVESIAVDATDVSGSIVYAALGVYAQATATPPMGTIAKSTDGGATWQQTSIGGKVGPASNWSQPYGERLGVDPNNGKVLYYASAGDGLWRSTDEAATWQQVAGAPTGDLTGKGQWGGAVGLSCIVFDKNSSTSGTSTKTLYLGAWKAGIYQSIDSGNTWKLLPGSPAQPYRATIDAQGILYVAHASGLAKFANGVWSDVTPAPEKGQEVFAIAIDPRNDQHLITARHSWGANNPIYLSNDGGKNWSPLQYRQQSGVPWWPADFWSSSTFTFAFDAHYSNRVLFTDMHGIWQTNDITAELTSWTTLERGHEEAVTFIIKSAPTGAPLLSGVADLGGFRHTSLTDYPNANFTIPVASDITGLDFSEADANFVVCCGGNRSTQSGGGAYSTNNGVSWTEFAQLPQPEAKNGRVAVSANGQQCVWVPEGDIPYVTKDRGTTWQAAAGAPKGSVNSDTVWNFNQPLASDRVDANTFYLYDGQSGKFYRSNNGGLTWATTSAKLPTSDWQKVEAVPGIAQEVWISLDKGGLWRSTDGGDTFTQIMSVQWAHLHSFGKPAPGVKNPTLYLYGTVENAQGVFRSDDNGASWQQLDTAQERVGVGANALAGDRQVSGRVSIGTNGRGILYATTS